MGAALLIVAGLGAIKAMQIGAMIKAGETFKMPPEAVTTAMAEQIQWQPTLDAVGSVVAVQNVTISSEVPGAVKQIAFASGADAKQGAILVKLDTSIEDAQLASARAEADLARLNLERIQGLQRASASSKSELDTSDARLKQAVAAVQNVEATIAKKTLRAPFSGRLGIRQVEVGQVVSPGAPIVTLQSVDPVYAEFWLPQQDLAQVRAGQPVRVKSDTFPGREWPGEVETVNSEVDSATRNVRVRARVANESGELRQGMFVDVEIVLPKTENVTVIPATSIMHAPYGDSVYVVEQAKDAAGKLETVAKQVFVRLGEHRGDRVAVLSGVKAGQAIVSSGAFKLRNGIGVLVQNDLAPNVTDTPTPADK